MPIGPPQEFSFDSSGRQGEYAGCCPVLIQNQWQVETYPVEEKVTSDRRPSQDVLGACPLPWLISPVQQVCLLDNRREKYLSVPGRITFPQVFPGYPPGVKILGSG